MERPAALPPHASPHGDVTAERASAGSRRSRQRWNLLNKCRAIRSGDGDVDCDRRVATGRYIHTATLLPNGQVLVAGGYGLTYALASAELYNPATGTWTATGSLATARYFTRRRYCRMGRCWRPAAAHKPFDRVARTELYDPATGSWGVTNNLLPARFGHTATLLRNGRVLVSGGGSSDGVLARADVYKLAREALDTE